MNEDQIDTDCTERPEEPEILNSTQARKLLAKLSGAPLMGNQRFGLMCRTHRINATKNTLHDTWEVKRSEIERFAKEDYQPHRRPYKKKQP
jgi:hypothetical protein